jgi:hypothetical protein
VTARPEKAAGAPARAQLAADIAHALADPRRVSPHEPSALLSRAGDSLHTSTYPRRHESLRILAYNNLQATIAPERGSDLAKHLETWLERLGAEPPAAAAA